MVDEGKGEASGGRAVGDVLLGVLLLGLLLGVFVPVVLLVRPSGGLAVGDVVGIRSRGVGQRDDRADEGGGLAAGDVETRSRGVGQRGDKAEAVGADVGVRFRGEVQGAEMVGRVKVHEAHRGVHVGAAAPAGHQRARSAGGSAPAGHQRVVGDAQPRSRRRRGGGRNEAAARKAIRASAQSKAASWNAFEDHARTTRGVAQVRL